MFGAEILRESLRTLWAHRGRAALTVFGVVWGTASVIFLVGWGEGVRVMLERGFFKSGRNLGQVWSGMIGEDFTPAADRRYLWFTLEDVEVLRRRARLAELVGAQSLEFLPAAFRQRSLSIDTRGIEPEVMELRGVPVAAGRGITRSDVEHHRRVVVLGQTARRRLLGAEGGIGSRIRMGGRPFEVVGLLAEVGTQLSRDRAEIDEQAWMPITTFQDFWPAWWTDEFVVHSILYRMPDRRLFEESKREVRGILADRLRVSPHDEEAIGIWSSVEMLSRMPIDQTRGTMFVIAVALLVIGGIGMLNMMLDSVQERRQEIGVRLAVGARRREIVWQFFLETFLIIFLGGALGVALGVGGCALLARFEIPDLVPVPILQPEVVVVAVAVMMTVGVGAGVIPAARAARVDPALTLRMD